MQGNSLIFKSGKVKKKKVDFLRQDIVLVFKNQETSKETVSGTFRPLWQNYVAWSVVQHYIQESRN